MRQKLMTLFLFSVLSVMLCIAVSPANTYAWPIQVDVFTKDINGNMLTGIPVDFDGTSHATVPWTSTPCQTGEQCFRKANGSYVPDIWPDIATGSWYTINPSYGGFPSTKGGWTTLRTAWGWDFNCAYSPLKETIDLSSATLNSWEVDRMEGDIFMPLNGIKYSCSGDNCACSDSSAVCFGGGMGTGSCNNGGYNVKNIEGCSFIKDPTSNKYWTHAAAYNGQTTQTTFVLKPTFKITINKTQNGSDGQAHTWNYQIQRYNFGGTWGGGGTTNASISIPADQSSGSVAVTLPEDSSSDCSDNNNNCVYRVVETSVSGWIANQTESSNITLSDTNRTGETSFVNTIDPTCLLQVNGQSSVTVRQGDPITLSWSTSNAISASITPSIDNITPNVSGSREIVPTQTTTYILGATGSVSRSCSMNATVTVRPAQSGSERPVPPN